MLRVPKMGHESVDRRGGDLMVKLKVRPHSYFRREHFDIHTDTKITITQALLGGIVEVATLYGNKKISIAPGTESGTKHKIVGYGLEQPQSLNHSKGNHYVHFIVVIPTSLNLKQAAALREYSFVEEPIQEEQIGDI